MPDASRPNSWPTGRREDQDPGQASSSPPLGSLLAKSKRCCPRLPLFHTVLEVALASLGTDRLKTRRGKQECRLLRRDIQQPQLQGLETEQRDSHHLPRCERSPQNRYLSASPSLCACRRGWGTRTAAARPTRSRCTASPRPAQYSSVSHCPLPRVGSGSCPKGMEKSWSPTQSWTTAFPPQPRVPCITA